MKEFKEAMEAAAEAEAMETSMTTWWWRRRRRARRRRKRSDGEEAEHGEGEY